MRHILLLTGLLAAAAAAAQPPRVVVGSKTFTESVVLGEILGQVAAEAGADASHRRQLGGTRVPWNALVTGEIDAYPEYTGTLVHEVLAGEDVAGDAALRAVLGRHGVVMGAPLGFANNYALGTRAALARERGLERISDLRGQPDLVLGFSNEFLDRADGWRGLRRHYRLPQRSVRGLDHDLAYRALAAGSIEVTDLYTTDAEIAYYDLRALEDDEGYFPAYQAVILYRADLARRAPGVVAAFERLAGTIDRQEMIRMNARVKLEGEAEGAVAADFLRRELGLDGAFRVETLWQRLARTTAAHLSLVVLSLGAAILVAVPLGILAARKPRVGQVVLAVTGLFQTIPSLALFVFMIPLLGIGGPPALAALFLYSLLPIVRNTHAGLRDIPAPLLESAAALGLPPAARLRIVELPLAVRAILAGIKTSAVINVGTATLAALIGAGGYGQPILTGIRLDDLGLILEGAVPAAVLALLVQGLFDLIERRLLPGPRAPVAGNPA